MRQYGSETFFRSLCLLTIAVAHISASKLIAQITTKQGVPVLAYHRFDPVLTGSTTITTATLQSQLDWLVTHHYAVVLLATVVSIVEGHIAAPPDTVAITVDDGHVSVYTILFPLVLRYRIPITLFIYRSAISNAPYAITWQELTAMKASGLVEVEAHTFWHPDFRKEKAHRSPADYQTFVLNQLSRSKSVLEYRLGSPITMMAWPFGIYDPDLEQAALRAGYVAAFAYAGGIARAGSDMLAIPRIPVANYAHGSAFAALLNEAGPQTRPASPHGATGTKMAAETK